ncbi:MAG TPA: T9SS type A sorting domain-containing protein [Bacteroidia bacterium]|nr:T9SS type A sorting domain-containing protein [Bacteroidia bacterium]
MKQFAFILCFVCCFVSKNKAQNLVPNGSFENYTSCPNASGQLTLCTNWYNPSTGTPDYLNACSPSLGVPSVGLGFQYAKTGNAMVGIWAFCNVFSNVREYVQSQLTAPLVVNSFYLVEYYINRANWSNFACNNISCLLSANSTFTADVNGLISGNPQVIKFNNDIIIDTLNWVRISSIYQASGGENYLTIGNFKNDALTTFSNVPGNSSSCAAYYLIDDVSLTNITIPQWQYRDTTIYLGDSVLIGPAITGLNIDWFDMSSNFIKNAPGIYVKPTVNTSYQATETFNSVVYNHTVNVIVLSPVKVDEYDKLQNSVKACPNPSSGTVNLKWNNIKNGEADISVTDISGKLVYQNKHQIVNTSTKFNIDATNGVYFVKISLANGMSVIKKIVKQ